MNTIKVFTTSLFILFNSVIFAQINQYHEDGTRHGVWERKFKGRDQVRYSGQFDHGAEVGEFRFYSKGLEGHPTAIKTFSENGKKAEVKFFTQRGRLISQGIEINKKKEGKWEYYHNRGGKVMMVEMYENGLLEGERLSYYDNGVTSEKFNFLHGKKHGKQLVYSIKGDASLAIKNSSSPTPIANGLPSFATTISLGLFLSKTAIAYAPTT